MIYRITNRGDPWGSPIVRGLGSDSNSPKLMVVERASR